MRLALALCCAGLALTPAAAHAVTLVDDSSGLPVGGQWQQWADQADVPTVPGDLILIVSSDPVVRGCLSFGCSTGPGSLVLEDGQLTAPWAGTQAVTWMAPAADRWTFYWELAHQFDWGELTDAQRGQFAGMWREFSLPWWDSKAALDRGAEDGLEGVFAAVYANCASGQPAITPGGWIDVQLSDPEASCALIDQIGGKPLAPRVGAVTITSPRHKHRRHRRRRH